MNAPFQLSVVVIVVSGPSALRRCLTQLAPQMHAVATEIIVPYDAESEAVAALATEFPQVRFERVDDASLPIRSVVRRHRRYDRCRAAGLAVARGTIIAMTEDHVVPHPDWCGRLLAAHASSAAAIGGAIENGIDRPVNWALYYCDFGRYGRPLAAGPTAALSDVNVSYKRDVLFSNADIWRPGYAETALHWHLTAHGHELRLAPDAVVIQERPPRPLGALVRERVALGYAFGRTRRAVSRGWKRWALACAMPALPFLLLYRCLRHMVRQRRTARQIAAALPYIFVFLSAYTVGELTGLAFPPAQTESSLTLFPPARA